MKKLVAVGLLALGVVLSVQSPAHGWWHLKMGSTWHIDWSCGNNSFLWHLYRNGQVPESYAPFYEPAPVITPAPAVIPSPSARSGQNHSSVNFGYEGVVYPTGYQPAPAYRPAAPGSYLEPVYYTPTHWYGW